MFLTYLSDKKIQNIGSYFETMTSMESSVVTILPQTVPTVKLFT